MMSSLTSVELNLLIFRYLQESGFTHAAFTLGYEAGINKSKIDGNMVPPGALVKFVQKGLHYMEMEANLTNGEVDIDDEDFSFFQPLDLISKDVNELQEMLRERKRKERDKEKDREENDKEVEHDGDRNRVKEKVRHEKKHKEREKMGRETLEMERLKLEREREKDREGKVPCKAAWR